MNTPLLIWYPPCSTCKKAHSWLAGQGIPFEERNIKTDPPTAEEMAHWVSLGGLPVKRLINTSGMLYRSMGLQDRIPQMTDEEILSLLATDGMLVKRPILVTDDGKVLAGFKEAQWDETLAK